jgi:DNA-binding PucR family transcriptional regulator
VTQKGVGEFGALAGERLLSETLLAYLDCGQDHTATAARLGVHRHAVSRRLTRAEELLGRPLGERRRELEAAVLIAQ